MSYEELDRVRVIERVIEKRTSWDAGLRRAGLPIARVASGDV